jgi:hypothetical protein
MLRRSSWDSAMTGRTPVQTDSALTSATSTTVRAAGHSRGGETPEPGAQCDSENADQTADQPCPSAPQGDAVLTPVLRMVGLTPRFSTAFTEHLQFDTRLLMSELRRSEPDPSTSKRGYMTGSRKSLGRSTGASLKTGSFGQGGKGRFF